MATTTTAAIAKTSWADDNDELPQPEVTQNPDGTKTVVSYRINPTNGRKLRLTQKIKEIKSTEQVGHDVAQRKRWAKYGAEKNSGAGPNVATTSLGEELQFKLAVKNIINGDQKKDKNDTEPEVAETTTAHKGFVCRTCKGAHMTMKCPFKTVLGVDSASEESADSRALGAGTGPGGSSYIAPHLRGKPPGAADPGRTYDERDEWSTLRVSNLSDDVDEMVLGELFQKFGRVVRCHVVRDYNTGRNRGFAFISYDDRKKAEEAMNYLDGKPVDHMIIRVEFSKKRE